MNPLFDDRDIALLLDAHLDRLLALPAFAHHDRESMQMLLASARALARDRFLPSYRAIDGEPPRLVDGRVVVHPRMHELYAALRDLDIIAAPRPEAVGGAQVPRTVFALATAYLCAANLSAYAFAGLTQGAAHLLEAFGSDALRERYMRRMYTGEWTGTMALTEPDAGSSLGDLTTVATPAGDHYLLTGSKIFISGGDHDLTDNIVHLTLARIRGAPAGMKGVSLFCVPKRRVEDGGLVDNDVAVTGVIHKIGWRGIPSIALAYGERGDCRGWLVGEPNQGIRYMFQMMNEARIMVGLNGVATASVAYHASLAYARERKQGRPIGVPHAERSYVKDSPPVAIIEHPDVRRMLLRQKAIVEGGLALLVRVSAYADLAEHAVDAAERTRAAALLDLLTPVAKSFPAEAGFEANALAVQVHGGYGYSSEFLPEAWLRDQKLNSIHEGTTGIQAQDLLGRRVLAPNAILALGQEIAATCQRARSAGIAHVEEVERAVAVVGSLTRALATRADILLHARDYLELFSIVVIAWQWLDLAASAHDAHDPGYASAKRVAAQYWIRTEVPRVAHLAALCESGEDSYGRLDPSWL